MVVDDDSDLTSALQLILEEEGFTVNVYPRLNDLHLALKEIIPDLLILDYWLPDGKSTEMIPILRQSADISKVPIVMISAKDTVREEALKNGVTSFLAKPFSIDQLLQTIFRFAQN